MDYKEMRGKAALLFKEAQAVFENLEATAEDKAEAQNKFAEACELKQQADKLVEIKEAVLDLEQLGGEEDKAALRATIAASSQAMGSFSRLWRTRATFASWRQVGLTRR